MAEERQASFVFTEAEVLLLNDAVSERIRNYRNESNLEETKEEAIANLVLLFGIQDQLDDAEAEWNK